MTDTDGDLAALARDGRRDAFDTLVTRHGPAVLAFLRQLTGRTEDALDLFQDTFLRAFRAIGRLEEPARFKAWLGRIALNSARRHFERRVRVPVVYLDDASANVEEPAAEENPTDARLDLPKDKERMRAAIERLPPRQKTVLSLRLNLGLPFAEIARQLGIREENARAHHYQALKALKRALASGGNE